MTNGMAVYYRNGADAESRRLPPLSSKPPPDLLEPMPSPHPCLAGKDHLVVRVLAEYLVDG